MLWPERTDNWRAGAKPAQAVFAAVAEAIAASEPVTIGVSAGQFQNARARLSSKVRLVEITSNDAWIRDCGPTFVIDAKGRRRGVDWTFNAWGGLDGGLYFPWDRDDEVAQKVLEIEGSDRYRTSFVLEGGAIHVDGQGTCLTTEECLLNPNRNPGLGRADIEEKLRSYLGVRTVIWLGAGVYQDETGGHIDELACFTSPGHVALTWTDDRGDPQYEISMDAYQRLKSARDARGRALTIHKIHQPGPLYMTAEEAAGVDRRAGVPPAPRGRPLAGVIYQFLRRQPARRDAALRQAPGPGRDANARAAVSDPRSGGRRDAGGAARRRQHPLHHPAGAPSGSPLSSPPSRMELCRAHRLESLYSTHPLTKPYLVRPNWKPQCTPS